MPYKYPTDLTLPSYCIPLSFNQDIPLVLNAPALLQSPLIRLESSSLPLTYGQIESLLGHLPWTSLPNLDHQCLLCVSLTSRACPITSINTPEKPFSLESESLRVTRETHIIQSDWVHKLLCKLPKKTNICAAHLYKRLSTCRERCFIFRKVY